jgi:hypothetical protein
MRGVHGQVLRYLQELQGGAVQVDPIKSTLNPAGTQQRLKLQYEVLLSISAFKFSSRPYSKAACYSDGCEE